MKIIGGNWEGLKFIWNLCMKRLIDFKSICMARQKIRVAGFSGQHTLTNGSLKIYPRGMSSFILLV